MNLVRFQSIPRNLSLFLAAVLFPLQGLGDTYYKWQTENGNWTYGAHPPTGVEAIAVTTTTGGNTRAAQTEQEASEQADNAENQETAPELFATIEQEIPKKERDRLCKAAKSNLETLSSNAIIRKRDSEGSVVVITEDERAAEIEKAKKTIKDMC